MYVALPFQYETAISFPDCTVLAGKAWRIGGYFPNVAVGEYVTLHFHTPADKRTLYQFSQIGKTGGDIGITLIEGGTYTNGSGIAPWNLNRHYRDGVCLLTDVFSGVSPTTTISGGIVAPLNYVGGQAQGNQKPGGSSEGGFVCLEGDTDYTLKISTLTEVTTINALVNIDVDV